MEYQSLQNLNIIVYFYRMFFFKTVAMFTLTLAETRRH